MKRPQIQRDCAGKWASLFHAAAIQGNPYFPFTGSPGFR